MIAWLRRQWLVARGVEAMEAELTATTPQPCGWCRDVVEPDEGLHVHATAYCSETCADEAERFDRQSW